MSNCAVLVVDDDLSILGVISEMLELDGHAVTTATNGQEALQALDQAQPALVLLDMRMPVMNGWEFAEELRARGVNLPIVVMTAAQNALQWAREIGARAYLAKPFELDEMLALVLRVCRESHARA